MNTDRYMKELLEEKRLPRPREEAGWGQQAQRHALLMRGRHPAVSCCINVLSYLPAGAGCGALVSEAGEGRIWTWRLYLGTSSGFCGCRGHLGVGGGSPEGCQGHFQQQGTRTPQRR